MDDELPEDLEDIEIIYSDGEYDGEDIEEPIEEAEIDDKGDSIEAEVIDLAALTFTKHAKSVFCSDLSTNGQVAVTGGEDDMAYLWNTSTGEVVCEFTGHKDSITEVCFNHDCQLVATGDMSGMIQVWCTKEFKLVWCFEGDDMEWLFWHPMANVLLCGCHSGDIFIWQIPQGNCKVLPAPDVSLTSYGKILPDGKHLLAGYADGQLRLWNIKESRIVWCNKDSHTITNIDINKEGTLAVVSPKAAIIKLSDGKTIAALLADGQSEIESALLSSELGIAVTGSLSGLLCVWELGRQVLRHQSEVETAVTILKWGADGKIFVGTTDGAVYICDVKNCNLLETLTGHKADILSISVFKDENKILTSADDGTAKIFQFKAD